MKPLTRVDIRLEKDGLKPWPHRVSDIDGDSAGIVDEEEGVSLRTGFDLPKRR